MSEARPRTGGLRGVDRARSGQALPDVPRVSVVVPARNIARYLGACLESVIGQTLESIEVLVVDDASTDDTVEVARAFAERDDRVRLLRHDEARGAGGARNTGIDAARGEYLAFVDADDWLREDALERIWTRCREAGAPVGLFPASKWLETEERLVPDHRTDLRVPDDFRIDPGTLGRLFMTVWTRIYERELVVSSGVRFPERLVHQDEYFHYCFFALVEPRVVTLDERIYVHRIRPGSTIDRLGAIRSDMPIVFGLIWDFFEEHGLAGRYGPLFCRTVAVQLRHILPQLEREAQEPFYEGVREIVRRIDRSRLELELPEPLPDLREHGYLAYLQRRQRQLREIEADPWRTLGTLEGSARARRMVRLGLEGVGLGSVVDRLARPHVTRQVAGGRRPAGSLPAVRADRPSTPSSPERSPVPTVSVLVAAYDVEPYLERCLDSLVGQTLSDIEVVVVDDASTDRTAEIAAGFEARDERVRLIRHEENRGAGGARNTALEFARGEWIAYVDGDDWMIPEALERIHRRCTSAGVPVGLFPALQYLEGEDRLSLYGDTALRVPERFRVGPDTLGRMPVTPWSKLYRRDFLKRWGVRFPERINNEDVQFFYCLFAKAEPEVVTLDEPLYVYRRRAGSMMGRQMRVREDGPTLLSNVWDFWVEEGLAERYGGVLAEIVAMHLTNNLPKLDVEAQEPFYEGMRRVARRIGDVSAEVPLPEPLPDVIELDYLGFLQRCQRDLSRLRNDPWYRFGRLPTGGKVKRTVRLALERAGLDPVVRAIQKLRGVDEG